ncbi:MAG: sigma-54-dependent Fis family transcriptional regulator [Desulfobacteraceae bacterium]|nr:MAG: sigma-54-dependent Fis family transcriptional regulator [Desulfobacteraceae bacterium]
MKSILVASVDRETLQGLLSSFGPEYHINSAGSREDIQFALHKSPYDLVFADIRLLGDPSQYPVAVEAMKSVRPAVEVVVVSPRDRIRDAVRAIKAGARHYLTIPVNPDEVRLIRERLYDRQLKSSELDYLRDRFWRSDSVDIVTTQSETMKKVFNKLRSVAPTKSTVLLVGETGTGKSLLAKLIHHHSNRKDAQFIEVHCGAIPDTLLESELFGHEKGAFTGAVRKRLGKFEIAKSGTIFLDEIGTITPPAQIKLLQVLQDGTFSRVGGEVSLHTDARVIAATNSDLKKMTEENQYRRDLYYRLNVFPIEIPALRERIDDLPFLIESFLNKLNRELQKNITAIHPHVLQALKSYEWPGNIRELENLIERAYILETSTTLSPESFPGELFGGEMPVVPIPVYSSCSLAEARRMAIEDFERQYLKELLARNKGKMNKASEDAGISTRQLHKLLIKYGIRKEDFKEAS